MARSPTTSAGISGLAGRQGLDAWTHCPPRQPAQTALVDPHPFRAATAPQFSFLVGSTPSGQPTNRLQIVATVGPNVPNWPDANHASGNLREFGLVAQLNGVTTLVNYVTHPVIVKDPASTLTRTIWLVL